MSEQYLLMPIKVSLCVALIVMGVGLIAVIAKGKI